MFWTTQLIAAFFGTLAFCILFQVPFKYFFECCLTGMGGWLFYLLGCRFTTVPTAIFIAALVVTGMSRYFAVKRLSPVTIFLIPGIFPLVPGAGIYYTAYYAFVADYPTTLEQGALTLKTAVAIVLGIVVVFALPPKRRSVSRKKTG